MTKIDRDATIWIEIKAKDLNDGDAFRPQANSYWGTVHRHIQIPMGEHSVKELLPSENFLFVLTEEVNQERMAYKIIQIHKDHKCVVSFRADEINENLKPEQGF